MFRLSICHLLAICCTLLASMVKSVVGWCQKLREQMFMDLMVLVFITNGQKVHTCFYRYEHSSGDFTWWILFSYFYTIQTWEYTNFANSGHEDSIWSLVYHSSTNQLISGSSDGTIRLWTVCKSFFSGGNVKLIRLERPKESTP